MPPSSDEQIKFLVNLQRLLDEGQFVASYKFALLLALADLSVEHGDDSGGAAPTLHGGHRREVHPILLAAGVAVSGSVRSARPQAEHRQASRGRESHRASHAAHMAIRCQRS